MSYVPRENENMFSNNQKPNISGKNKIEGDNIWQTGQGEEKHFHQWNQQKKSSKP